MQIRLTVQSVCGGAARGRDVIVTAPAGTALGAVAGGLLDAAAAAGGGAAGTGVGTSGGAVAVYAGRELLDPDRSRLGEPPLLDGAVLTLGGPAEPGHGPGPERAAATVPTLRVVAGPDAGGVHLLHGGQIRIGRSAEADVPLDDPDVSRLHCAVTVGDDGRITVADLGSTNGTTADGKEVGATPVPLAEGAVLRVGESSLCIASPAGRNGPGRPGGGDAEGAGGAEAYGGGAEDRSRGGIPGQRGPEGGASGSGAGHGGGAGDPSYGAGGGSEDAPGVRRGSTPVRGTLVPPELTVPEKAAPPAAAAEPAPAPTPPRRGGFKAWARRLGGREHQGGQDTAAAAARAARERAEADSLGRRFPDPATVLLEALSSVPSAHGGPEGRVGPSGGGGTGAGEAATRLSADGGGTAGSMGRGAAAGSAHAPGGVAATGGTTPGPLAGSGATAGPAAGAPAGGTAAGDARAADGAAGGSAAGPSVHGATAGPGPVPDTGDDAAVGAHGGAWAAGRSGAGHGGGGAGVRLFARGSAHPDGLTVRLGTSQRGGGGAAPLTVDLRRAGSLGLAGPRRRLAGVARSVVAQLAALHVPEELELVLIAADPARPLDDRVEDWGWAGWLPQLRPQRGQDCRLLLAYDLEQAATRAAELMRRLDGPPQAVRSVVVVDGDPGTAAVRDAVARLAAEGPAVGIHAVCLAETPPATPASPLTTTYEAACTASPGFAACGAVGLLSGDVATGLRLLLRSESPPPPGGDAGDVTSAAGGPPGRQPSYGAPGPDPAAPGAHGAPGTRPGGHSGTPPGAPAPGHGGRPAGGGAPGDSQHLPITRPGTPAVPPDSTAAPHTGRDHTAEQAPAAAAAGGVAYGTGAAWLEGDGPEATPAGWFRAAVSRQGAGGAGTVDAVSAAWAERLARALAPYWARDDAAGGDDGRRGALPGAVRLLDELGLARATPTALTNRWRTTRSAAPRVAALLGAGPGGRVGADLRSGPLAVQGTPGSGKSELLRSLTAALAAGEPPDRLQLVLIDGAGRERGGGLAAAADLPHVSGYLAATDPLRMREFAQELGAEFKRRAALYAPEGEAAPQGPAIPGPRTPGEPRPAGAGDIQAASSATLRLRPRGAAATGTASSAGSRPDPAGTGSAGTDPAGAGPTDAGPDTGPGAGTSGAARAGSDGLSALVIVVDDFDALVAPSLGSPARPAAGSVVRVVEAVAREGTWLGMYLVTASAQAEKTTGTTAVSGAAHRVELGGGDLPPGRGVLRSGAAGEPVPFQAARITGRIPRTATARPTVVPLEWARMGSPPTSRPLRELGNGPTDLALLASALQRAARAESPA